MEQDWKEYSRPHLISEQTQRISRENKSEVIYKKCATPIDGKNKLKKRDCTTDVKGDRRGADLSE